MAFHSNISQKKLFSCLDNLKLKNAAREKKKIVERVLMSGEMLKL